MTENRFLYEGEWELVPELSLYEQSNPPRSGTYRIRREGETVSFALNWTTIDGKRHEIAFSGAADGRREALPAPPGTEVSYLHVDGSTLDSSVFAGGHRTVYARRKASADGLLLAVVQETRRPDGTTSRNFQVYRKMAPRGVRPSEA